MSTNIAGVPIDFGPIVQEPDDVYSITGKYQMPCGCKLTQKVINKGSFGSSVATAEFIDMAKKRLIYWFEKRIPWHQCHLVASENPNGIISKDLRSNRTPPFGYLLESGQVSDVSIDQEIQAKGLTAPRITPADIEANIASEHYFTAQDGMRGNSGQGDRVKVLVSHVGQSLSLLTFCVLVLRNGFTVTGESACASPENFDAEIGKKIARANAVQKIWPLMGYALKQKLSEGGAA